MPNFNAVNQLDLSGQLVVVAGGTQGIGSGIALLCARLGATVAIIGRNAGLALEVTNKLAAASKDKLLRHAFISGDLSTVDGTKAIAAKIKDWVGEEGVDYLFLSQGGPPSAVDSLTSDGIDSHFAVQVLSRFILTTALLESAGLKSNGTVVSIAGAGRGSAKVDSENMDGRGKNAMTRLFEAATVIDCFTKELLIRHPTLRALHLYPGIVRTNTAKNSNAPMWLAIPYKLMTLLPGLTLSPDEYAPIALWTAASEEARQERGVWSWGPNGKEARPSAAADDRVLRERVWDKLAGMAKM